MTGGGFQKLIIITNKEITTVNCTQKLKNNNVVNLLPVIFRFLSNVYLKFRTDRFAVRR